MGLPGNHTPKREETCFQLDSRYFYQERAHYDEYEIHSSPASLSLRTSTVWGLLAHHLLSTSYFIPWIRRNSPSKAYALQEYHLMSSFLAEMKNPCLMMLGPHLQGSTSWTQRIFIFSSLLIYNPNVYLLSIILIKKLQCILFKNNNCIYLYAIFYSWVFIF